MRAPRRRSIADDGCQGLWGCIALAVANIVAGAAAGGAGLSRTVPALRAQVPAAAGPHALLRRRLCRPPARSVRAGSCRRLHIPGALQRGLLIPAWFFDNNCLAKQCLKIPCAGRHMTTNSMQDACSKPL